MPAPIVDYIDAHAWGLAHLEWHSVRRWDLLPPASLAYVRSQGWSRAPVQEGEPGNGLEFLAMHRMMLEALRAHDPDAVAYFAGWNAPPTDPRDAGDPLPGGATTPFDADMHAAIDRLEHRLDSFHSEDELGLYIETSFRPTSGHPDARDADRSTGIHNYLHNRFQDRTSPIDVGDPYKNLANQRFWRLHGWIDRLWSAYRAHAGLGDSDPAYVAAMEHAMTAMPMAATKGVAAPPPAELIDVVRAP
jgi:hypothetical protein